LTQVNYDFLVVATGLKLDYEAIEGMSLDLIGKDGIGSVYAGPEAAAATYAEMSRFADRAASGCSRARDRDEMRRRAAEIHLHHRGHRCAGAAIAGARRS
jgi:hypothetical protein